MKRKWRDFAAGCLLLSAACLCTSCTPALPADPSAGGATASVSGSASATSEASVPVMLDVWYWSSLDSENGSDQYRNLFAEWNTEHPDVQVRVSEYEIEAYRTKIKTALAAGETPDIFAMWDGSFIKPYIKTGNMLELDPWLPGDFASRIKTGLIESCQLDGKTYSVPVYTFVANLYCNTSLFVKAGAPIPKTWDEMLDAVRALRKAGITPVALGQKDRWPGIYWYDILAMRTAGYAESRNALHYPTLFAREPFVEAARMLIELCNLGAFSADAFEMGFNDMVDSFCRGEAAMMYQGNWVDYSIESEQSQVKGQVVCVPFPVVKAGVGTVHEFLGGNVDSFCVKAGTQHPKEAVDALVEICEQAGTEGEAQGMGISCWKSAEGAVAEKPLTGLVGQSIALLDTGKNFLGWWDMILPAGASENHKNLVTDLLGRRIKPDEFAAEMAKLIGSQY